MDQYFSYRSIPLGGKFLYFLQTHTLCSIRSRFPWWRRLSKPHPWDCSNGAGQYDMGNRLGRNTQQQQARPGERLYLPTVLTLKMPGYLARDLPAFWVLTLIHRNFDRHFKWCSSIHIDDTESFITREWENLSQSSFGTLPADGLAPLGDRASTGTVMMKCVSRIPTGTWRVNTDIRKS